MKNVKSCAVNTPDNSPTCPKVLSEVIDSADQKDVIDHQEIRSLTQMILRIQPGQVDESLQNKMAALMQKVKAQTA